METIDFEILLNSNPYHVCNLSDTYIICSRDLQCFLFMPHRKRGAHPLCNLTCNFSRLNTLYYPAFALTICLSKKISNFTFRSNAKSVLMFTRNSLIYLKYLRAAVSKLLYIFSKRTVFFLKIRIHTSYGTKIKLFMILLSHNLKIYRISTLTSLSVASTFNQRQLSKKNRVLSYLIPHLLMRLT